MNAIRMAGHAASARNVAALQRGRVARNRFRGKNWSPALAHISAGFEKLRWILKTFEGWRERAQGGELFFGNIDKFLPVEFGLAGPAAAVTRYRCDKRQPHHSSI